MKNIMQLREVLAANGALCRNGHFMESQTANLKVGLNSIHT